METYLDILKDWESRVANPAIYDNIDLLFPAYGFRRIGTGSQKDRWISPLKLDLSIPKNPNKEKTVVCAVDFTFREQGEWEDGRRVMDMIMEEYNCGTVYEAYRYAAQRLGLEMPVNTGQGRRERSRHQKLLSTLEDYFSWSLLQGESDNARMVREYLVGRGFTLDMAKKLRFGYVPRWEKVEKYITSERQGFTKEELDEACQVCSEDGRTTVGWKHLFAIPYRCGGELKGFLFRAIDPEVKPKYKATTGLDRKSVFFNMPEGREPKDIIVVEGEMDALTATANEIPNVVAMGGSDISGDRKFQIYDALGRNTRKIVLCPDLDTDKEGKPNYLKRYRAVRRSLHTIFDVSADFDEVYVAEFPYPSDPDEFIRDCGPDFFEEMIRRAKHWTDYLREGRVKII